MLSAHAEHENTHQQVSRLTLVHSLNALRLGDKHRAMLSAITGQGQTAGQPGDSIFGLVFLLKRQPCSCEGAVGHKYKIVSTIAKGSCSGRPALLCSKDVTGKESNLLLESN